MYRWRQLLPRKGTPQRLVSLVAAACCLLVVVPFFFWFFTWYGWALDPVQVERALDPPVRPTKAAAMLMQIAEKISRGDVTVRRYYERILPLAGNPDEDLRRITAWLMGKDTASEEFHSTLRILLRDPLPSVRHSAAVSLANFRDPAVRSELEAMLKPLRLTSPLPGRVQLRIQPGDTTRPATVVARVAGIDIVAGMAGAVERHLAQDGSDLQQGQELLEITPALEPVTSAQHALRLLNSR